MSTIDPNQPTSYGVPPPPPDPTKRNTLLILGLAVIGAVTLVAVVGIIALTSGGGSSANNDEILAEYNALSNKFIADLDDFSSNPADWEFQCGQIAALSVEGSRLPDSDNDEMNNAWDSAMAAYAKADDGGQVECTAALSVATDYINQATAAMGE